jgi:hypothetical protein
MSWPYTGIRAVKDTSSHPFLLLATFTMSGNIQGDYEANWLVYNFMLFDGLTIEIDTFLLPIMIHIITISIIGT